MPPSPWGLSAWALALCAAASASLLETERLHASVGGYAVFNCHLDFPFGNEIPYQLQWDKDVSTGTPRSTLLSCTDD